MSCRVFALRRRPITQRRMDSDVALGTGRGCCVCLVGCAAGSMPRTPDLVFLTRDGCPNDDTMRARFDAALTALGRSKDYAVIDAGILPESDPRRGYGTPTILYKNVDLFGMPEPPVERDAPT